MPELMKSVRFHQARDLRYELIPRPPIPGPGDVKVRIQAAGICGSDLHVSQTGAYITQIPVVMGHEFSGLVLEASPNVSGLAPGDHVIGDSRVACGACEFCNQGRSNLCHSLGFLGEVRDGAYAEEILIPAASLLKIDPAVPWETAALAEPLAVAVHAVAQARISGSPRTLILGAGPIGALIHQVARLKGLTDITVADTSAYRSRLLEQLYPGSMGLPDGPYDLVFETTGSPYVLKNLVPETVKKGGTMVMIGLFEESVPFDFNLVVEKEWSVFGCACFADELAEAVRLLETHPQRFQPVVSHLLPLRDYQQAFDMLLSPDKQAMKIIFQPELD
jgi:(R,R)-butanediol dehydrogenase/meso-butanediol dehydrogenase/diacetyl reductase